MEPKNHYGLKVSLGDYNVQLKFITADSQETSW